MHLTLKEIEKSIFAIIVPDRYDRAMLFCKPQEFYESPNPDFQGKYFSIWDYMKWYSITNKKGFTYPLDWSGFNIPLKVIASCYNKKNPYRNETPYDKAMIEILNKISKSNPVNPTIGGYLIGTDSLTSETFLHETKHAKFMVDPKYHESIQKILSTIRTKHPKEYTILATNILAMGYSMSVVEDEIQAYLQDRTPDKSVIKGLDEKTLKKLKSYFPASNIKEKKSKAVTKLNPCSSIE
jgi:hypothetical protein